MFARIARPLLIGGFCLVLATTACRVTVGPGGLEVSLLGKTITLKLGPDGLTIELFRNQTTAPQAVGIQPFESPPSQTPPNARMILRGSDVGVGRILTQKSGVRSQAALPSGTATVRFSVAEGQSAALCDSATFLAEYTLNLNGGVLSVADEVFDISQQALAVILTNNVTICVEVTADFEGQITLFEFSLSFGGGQSGTASFTMQNTDNENIHIMLPGDTFDESNRISPGFEMERSLPAVQRGDVITVQAGRNSVVLGSTTCPTVTGTNYTATVEWNGASVTCAAEQVDDGGGPIGPAGTTIQVPINALGDAEPPTATYGSVDYAVVGVLDVNSSTEFPSSLPSNITSSLGTVDVDLEELGLQYVERIYFATHAAWVPDLPDGIVIATLTCEYAEGGSPTTLDLTLGTTTTEWSFDRPDHDIIFGGVAHSEITPILYSFPTVSVMGFDYEGHVYSGNLVLDTSRTLSSLTLELGSVDTFVSSRVPAIAPGAGPATWAGQGLLAITLVGPAGQGGIVPPTGSGTVTGRVVNAQTGEPLAGVMVVVSGTSLSATTDADGQFTISSVPAGGQTLTASLTGFVQTTVPAVVIANATADVSIGMLALGAGGDHVAAVLAWGQDPRDLDLHMSGPDGAGGRFHAFYRSRSPVEHVFLDLDDTSSFGPETMTVQPTGSGAFVAGEYHVWIHEFAGDLTFAESGATVTLFAGGSQIAQYSVGSASGDSSQRIWQVVEFSVSESGAVSNVNVVQSFAEGNADSLF